jgi:hypothetical protein
MLHRGYLSLASLGVQHTFLSHHGGRDHDDPDLMRRELNPTVAVRGHLWSGSDLPGRYKYRFVRRR